MPETPLYDSLNTESKESDVRKIKSGKVMMKTVQSQKNLQRVMIRILNKKLKLKLANPPKKDA